MTFKIDPICGMAGKIQAHGEWFCSPYCIEKYEKENNLSAEKEEIRCAVPAQISLFKNKLFLTLLFTGGLFCLSLFLEPLRMFQHHFLEYSGMVWFPLLLGFLIGGLIEVYVPRGYIIKLLAQKSPQTIFRATALGFIFSGCSHGCLAIAFELYKKGASVPAVISFLLASPWANISITLLLFSFFGVKGFLILAGALAISLLTGVIFILLDYQNLIEKNLISEKVPEDFSFWQDIRERWGKYRFNLSNFLSEELQEIFWGAWHLVQMVLWWVVLGITLASLVGAVVPSSFFQNWMGKGFSGMGMTLLMATFIEICSEGSSPLAFEIYRQTQAFGNSFVFLMAGVITDYTEIGLLWTNIGKRTALWMVFIAVPLTLFLGTIFNFLF